MAVLLLSEYILFDHSLLHPQPTYLTDLPAYISPGQLVIAFIKEILRVGFSPGFPGN